MPISRPRIVFLSIALACAAGLATAAMVWQPPAPIAVEEPWIALPASGMDASEPGVRDTLAWMLGYNGLPTDQGGTLAASCGNSDYEPAERYELMVGDWVLAPQARAWNISLVPEASRVRVTVWDATRLVPPVGESRAIRHTTPPTVLWLPREKLEAVRRAWREVPLWHAPARAENCRDGQIGRAHV